jgi:nucleoside-diphosphate-sugar epimerase
MGCERRRAELTKRVLITGASGIAGRHLTERLRREGFDVTALYHRDPPAGSLAVDLRDSTQVDRLPAVDVIVHCAGLTPRRAWTFADFHTANTHATKLLLAHASRGGATSFVQVSTMGRLQDHRPGTAGRAYVVTKWLAERAARRAARSGLSVWILRSAAMYGEYDRGSMARLITAIRARRFALLGSGAQRKCLLYAGSLAAAITDELVGDLAPHRTESIADLTSPTMREVVEAIEFATQIKTWRIRIPDRSLPALVEAAQRVAELTRYAPARSAADGLAAAIREVRCQPGNALARHVEDAVSIQEGLRREVRWLTQSDAE